MHERTRQIRDSPAVAYPGDAGGNGDVGRSHGLATEDQPLLDQPVPDAFRSDRKRVGMNEAAAAEPDRQQIRHAEQGAHAADLDDRVRLARKSAADLPDIRRCAADIDDHRVRQARKEGRAAHRIGRAAGEAHDRQCRRRCGLHHCAVVLRQVERSGDSAGRDSRDKAGDSRAGQIDQRGIEERCIFPLEETDAAEVVRYGYRGIGEFLAKDDLSPLLAAGIERRKDRGNSHRADAVVTDLARCLPHSGLVERHDGAPVVVMPTFEHEYGATDTLGEVGLPVAERRQRGARRQSDPHRGDTR